MAEFIDCDGSFVMFCLHLVMVPCITCIVKRFLNLVVEHKEKAHVMDKVGHVKKIVLFKVVKYLSKCLKAIFLDVLPRSLHLNIMN
jgi:hypothetical protein